MTQSSTSLESAVHKFSGTKPYRQLPHFFSLNLEELANFHVNAPEESLFGIFGQWTEGFSLENSVLIEMIQYEDKLSHLFFVKRTGKNFHINIPTEPSLEAIEGLSISFICTDNEPYLSLLKQAIKLYRSLGVENLDLNVTFFGSLPSDIPEEISVYVHPRDEFNMARARNLGLKHSWYEHVFMLDVDVRLTKENIESIIKKYKTIPNHGVLNLKNDPTVGNGLYFGHKEVLVKNSYFEEFKQFWYEDTEFLMNFSRLGIIPVVVFEPFVRIDHERSKTLPNHSLNFNLFSNILHRGQR